MTVTSLDKIEKFIVDHVADYKIDARLLRDVAYCCLRDAILSLDVTSGDVLSEVRLSDALGISRTPTRAAIQQLVHDGLLDLIPGRAIVIAFRSITQVLDALHVRQLLEPDVCRLVAHHITKAQLTSLETYTQQLEEASLRYDRSAWTLIDVDWHETISSACPNQLLGQMVLQAKIYMHKQGVSAKISDEYLIQGTKEHRLVVNAIIAGDGDAAAHCMLAHLQSAREHLLQTSE